VTIPPAEPLAGGPPFSAISGTERIFNLQVNMHYYRRARQVEALDLQGRFAKSSSPCVLSPRAKNLNKLTQSFNDIGRPPY
jgi:hypothetical protein